MNRSSRIACLGAVLCTSFPAVTLRRLLIIICLPSLFALMTGCANIKTCSFRLDFIDDTPSDIADYSIVEVDSHELVQGAPWGGELYSDALTNANSMALTTTESLRNYRLFLKDLSCLEKEELRHEMESIRSNSKDRLPELDAQALLQKCTSAGRHDGNSSEDMISLSRNLASWIWGASQKFSWTMHDLDSMPMLWHLLQIYSNGGIDNSLGRDYWDENKRKCWLQSLAYACILSERCPGLKRLYVDEQSKIRDRVIEHGRVPLPVHVDVVDERRFVFKDCNRRPFAELTMHFNYGYFARAFEEVHMDSKMAVDMAFRALLHRYNKGSRITGDIRHNLETRETKMEVKGL